MRWRIPEPNISTELVSAWLSRYESNTNFLQRFTLFVKQSAGGTWCWVPFSQSPRDLWSLLHFSSGTLQFKNVVIFTEILP